MESIILSSIILALVITNVYLFSRMLDMNEKYMKAFMARNLTDYTSSEIIKADKKPKPVKDEPVEVGQADDKVFNKFLKQIDNGQEQPEI